MKKIRNGIFETNSSSSHSIVISSENYVFPENDEIYIETGEYGWEIETYESFSDKVSYALTFVVNYNPEKLEMLNRTLVNSLPLTKIYYNNLSYDEFIQYINNEKYHNELGYIDHQSVDRAAKIFKSEEDLFDFLFSENSYFTTDNDNH